MTTTTKQSATIDQRRELERLGSAAVGKALDDLDLDVPHALCAIEHSDELLRRIRDTALHALQTLSHADDFIEWEEVPSHVGYPPDHKVRSIEEQTATLRLFFPELGDANEGLAKRDVPEHAEGWFAIPKWQKVAPTYVEAVKRVLNAIDRTRNSRFHSRNDDLTTQRSLRQSAKTEEMFAKICEEQSDHDILVVPAQFGLRHRGRSGRRARRLMPPDELGLGVFAVGVMILTHPERFSHHRNKLWVLCAGDELDNGVSEMPIFRFPRIDNEGEIVLSSTPDNLSSPVSGSASAFVLQS